MSIASELNKLVQIFKNWPAPTPTPDPYVLPPATDETLGGIKVGDGLEVTEDGTLSASGNSIVFTLRVIQNTDKGKNEYEFVECTHTQDEILDLYRNAGPNNKPTGFVKIVGATTPDYHEMHSADITCFDAGLDGNAAVIVYSEILVGAQVGNMTLSATCWYLDSRRSNGSWGDYSVTTKYSYGLATAITFSIDPTNASRPVASTWKPLGLLDVITFVRQVRGGVPLIQMTYATHDSENSVLSLNGELVVTSTSFRIEAYHAGELLGWVTIDENNAWVWNVPVPDADE